ncbi:hypothetical protein PHET_01113 [Paragonimus heterotremus]|uniref:Uncharacterized protein n=1 Tax=Paragonimus heterotremus TaxID=100268 RepID=A0A8J4X3A5_9TREM|nr:hypothetical protein PHET_01113 [Paragonimus heterotremus]
MFGNVSLIFTYSNYLIVFEFVCSEDNFRHLRDLLCALHREKSYAHTKPIIIYAHSLFFCLQNLRQLNSQLQCMHTTEIQTAVRNLCQLRKHTSKRIQAVHMRIIPSFIQELTKSLTTQLREKLEKELSQRAEGAQSSGKRLEAELARYRKLIQTMKQEQEQSNENSRRKVSDHQGLRFLRNFYIN